MSLDGVDFRVNEPHPFDRRYYSHKFNHAGLKYEIGLSFSGKIVWVAGGIPCGVGDRELAESSLVVLRIRFEQNLADQRQIANGIAGRWSNPPHKRAVVNG